MPLEQKQILENDAVLAIWNIQESENQLITMIKGFSDQINEINQIKSETRRREKLATLVLLNELGISSVLQYQGDGKPYLKDSKQHISISHSQNFVAVLVAPKNCSIDIEINNNRVNRISSKFVNPNEEILIKNDLRKLQLIWSAKETAYKLIPSKGIDFKDNMSVDSITESTLELEYCYLENRQRIVMNFLLHKEYQLVYVVL